MFAYRLALAMGRLDVDGMLAEMTTPQLMGWMEYHRLDPWGEERADIRNASLMALTYNLLRRKGAAKKVKDFMLRFRPREPMKPEKMLDMLKMAATLGKGR